MAMSSNDIVNLVEFMTLDKMSEMHTITIAKIVKVNDKTIDVKPVFKRKVKDREIEYPVFTKVPPLFNYGGANYHAFPLAIGDYCLLLVNERAFDNWYEGLDYKTPLEYRMFDYSDSFALPMAKNKLNAVSIPKDGRTHLIGDTYQQGDYEHLGNRVEKNGVINIEDTSDIVIATSLGNVSLREFIESHYHTGDSGGSTGTPII